MTLCCASSLRESICKLSTKHEIKSVGESMPKKTAIAVTGEVRGVGQDQILLESEVEWLSYLFKICHSLQKRKDTDILIHREIKIPSPHC